MPEYYGYYHDSVPGAVNVCSLEEAITKHQEDSHFVVVYADSTDGPWTIYES